MFVDVFHVIVVIDTNTSVILVDILRCQSYTSTAAEDISTVLIFVSVLHLHFVIGKLLVPVIVGVEVTAVLMWTSLSELTLASLWPVPVFIDIQPVHVV